MSTEDVLRAIQALATIAAGIILRKAARPMTAGTEEFSSDNRRTIEEFCTRVENEFRLLDHIWPNLPERLPPLSLQVIFKIAEEKPERLEDAFRRVGREVIRLRRMGSGNDEPFDMEHAFNFCHTLAGKIAWVCTIPHHEEEEIVMNQVDIGAVIHIENLQ